MGLSAVTYALCKKYTDASLDGIGALKGAPCKVQSVVKTDGRSVVTLEWKSDSGIVQTSKVYVNDGISIWISGREYAVKDVVINNDKLYICNTANTDTTFDDNKWDVVINSGNEDFNIIDTSSELPASLDPTDRKIYYCIGDNTFYLWNGTNWSTISTGGGAVIRELTLAQYEALTPAEKMNGTIYFVTDEEGGSGKAVQISELPPASLDELTKIYQYVGNTTSLYTNGCFLFVLSFICNRIVYDVNSYIYIHANNIYITYQKIINS